VAGLATAATRRLGERVPGGTSRWTRTNHRGEPVSMLEGPAVAAGLVAGALVAAGRDQAGGHRAIGFASALAGAGAGAFGVVDDLAEDTTTRTKGLRGHLGALAHGRVTTGGLKVLGIGACAATAALVAGRAAHGPRTLPVATADLVLDAALVAGTANLVNLLDLRPGRALKAALAASGALAVVAPQTRGLAAAAIGAAVAAGPGDLAERDMLGDGGANALGALVGAQAAFALPRGARCAVLAGVVGLTLASEKVSFSTVIDATPALRAVDRWGRRA
jgi:UDP-N-acetylmuramyl pentapeptide phosphotransferase/UDP-N-acetylglucosamine-1-phosphate transferase